MKILKLQLKNFAAVKLAMDCNELMIDLSKSINKICLLIGPNGSGKTTILSMLHPFADVGNLDIRNGNSLIIDDKEGYKEIHIKKNDDIYVIKHFYTPHSGKNHSVKSYISKNDVELNINGNVTSFKEYVKIELQIEPEYLKLIRLGSNVTSLIGLSATERKTFMSKIMDDIGIYLNYYKSVNTKLRQVDEMISHSIDKMNRLNILDKKEFKKEIDDLKKISEKLESEFIQENSNLGIYRNKIEEIEDHENLKENLSMITKKFHKMSSIMEKKNQIESFDVNYYNSKITELNRLIDIDTNEYSSNIALIQNSLQHLNTLQDQLRTYEIQLMKERESDKEIIRMDDNLNNIRLKLREYENTLDGFKPSFTKKEFEDFLVFLKNTQNILRSTYEFGKPPIKKVIDLLRNKKNVMNYINSHIIDLDEKKTDNTSVFLSTIASRFMFGKEDITIDCATECQAKTLFMQIQNLLRNYNVEDKSEDISFYHDMEYVYSNIISIIPKFSDYKEIIESLPEDIKNDFMIDKIYDNISDMGMIYNNQKMNDMLSIITEYDGYQKLQDDYSIQNALLTKFSNMSNSSYLSEQYDTTSILVNETKEKISKFRERNSILTEEIDENKKTLEVCEEIKETIERYDEIKVLYEKYTNEYTEYKATRENISNTEINISRLKLNIDNNNSLIQKKIVDLSQYETLSNDIEKMNKIYDEISLTRDALSSKQGIPLRIIGKYLNNTEAITNELLDIAYDGKIVIDEFKITPTEFSIPFYNKGKRLEDVKYASQGELSFLSIALTFALSSQALSKYNIMLLDEIDGPLDTINREKFIRILENQIERIDSEQNFLITHNSMFSSYPVDILDLSFKHDDEAYPLANYIEIKRK